jgi:hypothetical protein
MLHQRWVASSILATYRLFLSKNFDKVDHSTLTAAPFSCVKEVR